jgi:spectrin beta
VQALELELDTYSGIVTEMGHVASAMVASKHPDCMAISQKESALSQQMRGLQKLAAARQRGLMESLSRHEYLTESEELDQWIREMTQAASSDDYGQDYEHLVVSFKLEELFIQMDFGDGP